MIYLELFYRFFIVGLCSLGGGYSAMPVIQSQVVDGSGWMTQTQFADVITLSEMTPGPIILNAATFTGNQVAGIPGAVIATFGSIFPALIIVSLIAVFYFKNKNTNSLQTVMSVVRPAIASLILTAALSLLITAVTVNSWIARLSGLNIDLWQCIMVVICIVLLRKFKKSPITIIVLSACSGFIVYGLISRIGELL